MKRHEMNLKPELDFRIRHNNAIRDNVIRDNAIRGNAIRGPRRLRRSLQIGLLSVLLTVSLTSAASARAGKLQISPFLDYQFGAGFSVEDFEFGDVDLNIDDSDGFGVAIDFALFDHLDLEFLALRQSTELSIDEGFFSSSFPITKIDVDYYHAGILWHGNLGQVQPFLALSAGVTRLDPDGLDQETRPSFSLGGGVKIFFTEHVGIRGEARIFSTIISYDDQYDRYCRFDCDGKDNSFSQGFVALGLVLAF